MRPQQPLLLAALLQVVHACCVRTPWPLASRALKQEELREHMLTAVRSAMLIDCGEHVLSPAAAPVSAASYACVRLRMLPRYLDALVQ